MFNLLRFIVIIVVAIIVFGWGVVAGQTDATPVRGTSPKAIHETGVSRNAIRGVRLEAMPEIPAKNANSKSGRSARANPFAESLAFSRPDFGPLPQLAWKRVPAIRPKPNRARRNASTAISSPTRALAGGLQLARSNVEDDDYTNSSYAAAPPVGLATSIVRIAGSNPKLASKTVSIKSATVNHPLLAQRIEAHNLTVRAIQDRLNEQDDWDLSGIESIVAQIDSAIQSQEMWMMYWRILPPRQQSRLGSVVSLSAALEKLRQRIFETRVATDVDVDLVSNLSERQTKARLSSLTDQVETWMREIR